jgi:hypothetical protein
MSKRIFLNAWLAFLPLFLLSCASIASSTQPLTRLLERASRVLTPVTRTLSDLNEYTPGVGPGAFPGGSSIFQGDHFALSYPEDWQIEVQQTTDEPESTTFSNQERDLALFGVIIGVPGQTLDAHAAAVRALGVDGPRTLLNSVPATITLHGRSWQQSAWTIIVSNQPFEIHVLSLSSATGSQQCFVAFGSYQEAEGHSFVDNVHEYFWPMMQSLRFVA